MAIYNNPGNIETGGGFAGDTGDTYGDNRFAVFDSKEMGIRAIFRDLRKKMKDFDGDINSMISKYAPPTENETKDYVDFVKDEIGSDIITPNNLRKAVEAVIKMENKEKTANYYLKDTEAMDTAESLSKVSLPSSTKFKDISKLGMKSKKEKVSKMGAAEIRKANREKLVKRKAGGMVYRNYHNYKPRDI